MITLTKTINKLPKNPLLKTNKGEHRFEMNIKTRTGNPQQTTPQAPCFPHFFGGGGGGKYAKKKNRPIPFWLPADRHSFDTRHKLSKIRDVSFDGVFASQVINEGT